jgi:hypothetical protein
MQIEERLEARKVWIKDTCTRSSV